MDLHINNINCFIINTISSNGKTNNYYLVNSFNKGKKVKLKYDSFLKAYFKYIELNVLSWLSVILPFD